MPLTRRQFDLTALTVLCASWLHAPHFPLWLTAALTALIAVRWLQRRLRPAWGKPPALLRLPLTLALPVVVYLQYGNIFGLDPGSVFAVGMLVFKLGESETARDARAVATFASFVLMAALLFEQDLLTTLYVGIGVIPLLLTLRALESDDTAPTLSPTPARRGSSVRAVVANLFAALPLALLVFLFLPRLAAPLWATQTVPQGRTGISDSMSPGDMSELFLDNSPAFRVSFDNGVAPPTSQRYWRGVVLWRYNGRTWSRAGGQALIAGQQPLQALAADVGYEITLEPSEKRWLFALDMPLTDPSGYLRDEDYTLASARPISKLLAYSLRSAPQYRLDGLSHAQRQRGLRLPAEFNPRSIALGQQWAAQHGGNTERIVAAALTLIRDEFRYTLSPPPLGRDAMDDFLFETKAGFCEHFASAFAVLMRAAGVPTRVVIGYQGGYWNDTGSYMVVRQSDAHAWNEVWIEGRGWLRIDPTAAVSPDRVELGSSATNGIGGAWLLALQNRWDLVNRVWTQLVVQFDELQQRNLLSGIGIDDADWRQLGITFALCMSLLAALGLWWAFRRDRDDGDALDRAYARLCARLARRGLERQPAEGPADYLQRLLRHWPHAHGALEPLFARYVQLRYAQAEPDSAAVRDFARAARRVEPRR